MRWSASKAAESGGGWHALPSRRISRAAIQPPGLPQGAPSICGSSGGCMLSMPQPHLLTTTAPAQLP